MNTIHQLILGLQEKFDEIRNVPEEDTIKLQELKEIQISWKNQVDKIREKYNTEQVTAAGTGAVGIAAGIAVAALAPTFAMGVATTFGVASTGTAISALSGAAATNAALAWLRRWSACSTDGGGMTAGTALLGLAGPVGWTIAGVAIIGGGYFIIKGMFDKETLEKIYINVCNRDINSYNLAIIELHERIDRLNNEFGIIRNAIDDISTFGNDYEKMTEQQQYTLGAYVNLMNSSVQLLVNPILGLQPKVTENDYDRYMDGKEEAGRFWKFKGLIISLVNMLYDIRLEEDEKQLLFESFKGNDKFLEGHGINRDEFDYDVMRQVEGVLNSR